MSGTQKLQPATVQDEMMGTGNIKADVDYLHHAFGELSVAEMDIHSSELHKK